MIATIESTTVLFGRHMRHLRRTPERLLGVTLLPVAYVVLFGVLFGSAMNAPGGSYRTYLMAGILAQTMLTAMSATAQGVAADLKEGIVDRLRSMSLHPVSAVLSRVGSNVVLCLASIAVMVLVGLAIGWRMSNGILPALAGFGLLLMLGMAMSLIGFILGVALRDAEAINSWVTLVILPVTFLSNAFIPLDGLPSWLATVCEWNPLSTVVTACRQLFGNPAGPAGEAWPMQHPVEAASIFLAIAIAVLVPYAARMYARSGR